MGPVDRPAQTLFAASCYGIEQVQLHMAAAAIAQRRAQFTPQLARLPMSAFSPRAQHPQPRLSDATRTRSREVLPHRAVIDRAGEPLHTLVLTRGFMGHGNMQIDERPESRGHRPLERV